MFALDLQGQNNTSTVNLLSRWIKDYSRKTKRQIDTYLRHLNQDIQDFNTRRHQHLRHLHHIQQVNQSITQHQTAATVLQTYTRRFLARQLVNRLRQQQVIQQPTPVQTPNNPNPDNNLPIMDLNQFNNLMLGLTNLSNAIQAQTAAPAPARELSFAKITDFFGDSQDPIGWLQLLLSF